MLLVRGGSHHARLWLALQGEEVMPQSFVMGLPGMVSPPEVYEGTGEALPIPLGTFWQ